MSTTSPDEDCKDGSDEYISSRVMAFNGKYESSSEYNDEDISDKGLSETYKLLYIKWEDAYMVGEKQKKTIMAPLQEKEKLVSTITGLEEEVILINSKLENMPKYVCMLNNGSNTLYEILEIKYPTNFCSP